MEIIKDAFFEGRSKINKWDESEAKQNQIKLEVALDNFSSMKKREFQQTIRLQQICPKTGKILNTFNSRLEAAKHICLEILKRPEKNPIAITGNMQMCISNGWKSYGFYWKVVSNDQHEHSVHNAKSIIVTGKGICAPRIYQSIERAANFYGMSEKTIKKYADSKEIYNGLHFRYVNSTPKDITFGSIVEAQKFLGISDRKITNLLANNKPYNNYTIKLDGYKSKLRYKLFTKDGNVVYDDIQSISKKLKIKTDVIHHALSSKKSFGNVGQYRIKFCYHK